jgi:hypothetical protein
MLLVAHLTLIRKKDALHTNMSPFILPHPARIEVYYHLAY